MNVDLHDIIQALAFTYLDLGACYNKCSTKAEKRAAKLALIRAAKSVKIADNKAAIRFVKSLGGEEEVREFYKKYREELLAKGGQTQ